MCWSELKQTLALVCQICMESCAGEMPSVMTAGQTGDVSAQHGPSMNRKSSCFALICLIVLFATAIFIFNNLLIDLSYLFPFLHSFLPQSTFKGKGTWRSYLESLLMSLYFFFFVHMCWHWVSLDLFSLQAMFLFMRTQGKMCSWNVSYQTWGGLSCFLVEKSSIHIIWYQGFACSLGIGVISQAYGWLCGSFICYHSIDS